MVHAPQTTTFECMKCVDDDKASLSRIMPRRREVAGKYNVGGRESRCVESHLAKELNIISNNTRSREDGTKGQSRD
jgi:hypothetical protein